MQSTIPRVHQPEYRARLTQLAKEHTLQEIADVLQISYSTICRDTNKLGIIPRPADRSSLDPADRELIIELYAAGVPIPEIAEKFEVTTPTIYNYLHRAGAMAGNLPKALKSLPRTTFNLLHRNEDPGFEVMRVQRGSKSQFVVMTAEAYLKLLGN